jgi:hypothetical protein
VSVGYSSLLGDAADVMDTDPYSFAGIAYAVGF